MTTPIKHKVKLSLFLLPIFILIVSALLNLDKFSASILKGAVHAIFQAAFIYGLLGTIGRWLVIRIIIAFVVTVHLFAQISYSSSLSISIIMSVLNSSPSESLAFIQFNILFCLVTLVLFLGLILIKPPTKLRINTIPLIVGLIYVAMPTLATSKDLLNTRSYQDHLLSGTARGYPKIITATEFLVLDMSWRFPPISSLKGVIDTINLMSIKTQLTSTWTGVTQSEQESKLLVLGIGESLRANNLSILGYKRATTPLLAALSEDITIFTKAYAAGTNTWSSIPAILTKVSSGPDISKSIINLAKDAGYETYWISNHTQFSKWDFSVSAIADQADYSYFPSNEKAGLEYDAVLIKKLEDILASAEKSTKNRLIVLHFYGSHMNFSDRYPSEFDVFNGPNQNLNEYDNSILYSDFLQSKLLSLVSEHNGEYLFFADHGLGDPNGEIPLKHDTRSSPDIDSIKVPMFVSKPTHIEMKPDNLISLYYFECIFAQWAQINAQELNQEYCIPSLDKKEISYIDSNLKNHEVALPKE